MYNLLEHLSSHVFRLFQYQRSSESIEQYGSNKFIQWRTDGTGIAVVTNKGYIILCSITLDVNESYQCTDKKTGYRLHTIPSVPKVTLTAGNVVEAQEEICHLALLDNNTVLFTTKSGYVKQFLWDEPAIIDNFSCKVSSFLFTDPTQHTFVPDEGLSIINICYSQALDIAAVAFSSGHGAYLATSHTFKPGTTHALLAPGVTNAVCCSINPRFHLIVYGTSTGEVLVFILNYDTGLLNLSHTLKLDKNSKAEPGRVTNMFWTPDGCCLCVNYESGMFRMWSVYGVYLFGDKQTVVQGCWGPEGYNLWCISGTSLWMIPFLKSPLTTNSVSSNQHHIVLQGAHQIYILPNQFPAKCDLSVYESIYHYKPSSEHAYQSFLSSLGSPLENWPWQVIQVPDVYSVPNSPIRYTAIGPSGQCTAVAGVRGFAFYISAKHKWKCFGSEAQEQATICRGGLLWWQGILIVACYKPETKQNEIQMYPHHSSLDVSSMVDAIPCQSTIITMNTHADYLIVMVAGSSRIILYSLTCTRSSTLDITVSHSKVLEFSIAKFTPHPSAVLSVHLTTLRADASIPSQTVQSVLVNIAGKLLMFQISGKMVNIAVLIV